MTTTTSKNRTLDIGVDVDGVLYPLVAELCSHAVRTTGRPAAAFPEPQTWNFATEWGLTGAELMDLMHDAVDNGDLLLAGAPYPGAAAGLRALQNAGHRIHIVTDRAGLGHVSGRAQLRTQRWLEQWAVPFDTLTFTADKTSVHTDVFIDDRPENYLALVAAGVDTYLREHPYNAHVPAPQERRVSTFASFTDRVLAA